ncbi:MAG: zinc-dependent peptidase [bacterium]|nr:zinc-dependent peptidase [bacterium]
MVLDWLLSPLRHRARRKLIEEPFPADWQPHLGRLPFYRALDARGQERIRDDLRVLVAEKEWEGCGGLELTDEIRVTIAAQASLLLLNIEHEYYRHVESILIYPSTFKSVPQQDGAGVVHEGRAHLGEAWRRGPVVLAWDASRHGALDPKDGHNLVLHEFAHKLDLLDGLADGTPPLPDAERLQAWVSTMTREFEALRIASAAGRATVLDYYGATNPAEFFAVATECFFEKSARLRRQHGALYAVLRDYYGQDPAATSK